MPRKSSARALRAVVTGLLVGGAAVTAHAATASGPGEVGPPHRFVGYDPTKPCDGTGPTPATGWCSYYTGATSTSRGHDVVLATDVCRLSGLPDASLSSDDGDQADFSVGVSGDNASWTWSNGRSFDPAATTLTVKAGTCVEWFVTWRAIDNDGQALPAGTYYLSAAPLVEPSTDPATVDIYDTVAFTVR